MKRLIFSLLALLLSVVVSYSQQIGIVRNAQYRITANLDPVKKDFEKLLAEHQLPAVLTNFEIKTIVDKVTGNPFYMLVGTNRSRTIKVARALHLSAGYLNFYKGTEEVWGILICSGCTAGCLPEISNGKWLCNGDCQQADQVCKTDIVAVMPQ